MDRHPQQIKRTRQDKTRHTRNVARLSTLKTAVKNVLNTTDKAEADKLYANAVSTIDKMASKNMIHKNTAARRKSQITRHLNSLS
ncbi:MAG: 30S ribosomal protein S20 [Candidatus Marinimicrobia bacterium]|jgi:small subunit ribosomal protein S20|nr:30S ribosomal protein S20 [Candidatus Neomarinimicrobiota bacterium]MBT3617468.1 30S ribosomal protein S20 [Candidatus Neomarinimicrobiota bacterium]MBT3829408.1 30S ribosomal protein S20 [Candidatus Neomarinimicrobiota bacterium]MBT3997010.1 30S ribosomal protein S20 [Candidatus Neomarinimicrobiota bacterium]MBT4281136.1 30S ribosomal protein S20 [Candidatus Neomarinimicrobiota bacterium]